jgi:hypothetical protein
MAEPGFCVECRIPSRCRTNECSSYKASSARVSSSFWSSWHSSRRSWGWFRVIPTGHEQFFKRPSRMVNSSAFSARHNCRVLGERSSSCSTICKLQTNKSLLPKDLVPGAGASNQFDRVTTETVG